MKKYSDLRPQEKQELAWTQKRVNYHNRQAKGTVVWMEEAQYILKGKMEKARLAQIFVPMHLNEETATECLFNNPILNKVHSMYCDLFEELPYRPDMAFDVIWRSFEVMSKYYCGEVLGNKAISDVDMFTRISKEVILPVLKNDSHLEREFQLMMDAIPDSTLRYMVVRLYMKRELGVSPQLGLIKSRAIDVLSKPMYDDFHKDFFGEDGNLTVSDHRSAVRRMRSILTGETVELNGNSYKTLDSADRIELLVSCILYVSRCERYHGDYFSQLKSSLAKSVTYHNFYYLITITDLLFWMVWYKFADHQGILQFFNLEDLAACAEQRRQNMETIFASN